MLSEDKIKELTGIVGEETAKSILAINAQVSKEVADVEARYKEFADVTRKETPAPASTAINDLVVEMVKQQGDFAVAMAAMEKGFKAQVATLSDELAKAKAELASVKAEIAPPAAAPSQAPETKLTKEQIAELIKPKGIDDPSIDPFFQVFAGGAK